MAIMERLNGVNDGQQRRRSRGTKVALWASVLALLVALLGGLLGAFWWWTHPTLITVGGFGEQLAPRPVARAAASFGVIFPKVRGQATSVTLDKVGAIVAENTADATITFSICHMSAGESPIGAVHDPTHSCGDLVPLLPRATFDYGVAPDSDYLVMTVTPTRPGVVRVTGVDVTYSTGPDSLFRHGTQRGDVQIQVTAR